MTAQDFEDASVTERKQFSAAPRSSDSEDSNVQSLNRLLHKKLVLLCPDPYKKNSWELPTTLLKNDETLMQAAERCVKENMGDFQSITFYGNAPRKLYKYTYPKPVSSQTGFDGGKIFIFKAELNRHAKFTPSSQQFRWLSRDELKSSIKDKEYLKSILSFIFE